MKKNIVVGVLVAAAMIAAPVTASASETSMVAKPAGVLTRSGCLGSAPAQGGHAGWMKTVDKSGECTLTIAADASGNDAMPNDANVISGGHVDSNIDHIVFQGPNKTKLNNVSAGYFKATKITVGSKASRPTVSSTLPQ
ncbi:hypothetical protein OZX57_07690 [Bifidobacterium sp. ESL0682]|uniref:hypothetical protein n=1 Tax=Bifidobacterium sp. ESL0682 TaxID=2983212 RepID=UPI0023F6F43D|nr:hypothetical protein [Bifidobacterium sp. ESL0682]WEV41820.1 hypothetical protein OZX57_07690 [Bifidobacterium sp. ESL0682]